jgi:hypothetical protein
MKLRNDGTYGVAPGEKVNLKIVKQSLPFAATVSALIGDTWDQPTSPNGLTETNSFTAPPTAGNTAQCTVIFDFIPDQNGQYAPGDHYDVSLTGSGGGGDQFSITPPPIQSTALVFVVE